MQIKVLAENTSISKDFGSEHGLSLHIKTAEQSILFDVGAGELFAENAKKLDVNIADVDLVVISHGHYDHGGGLNTFFSENTTARVLLHRLAFEKYYAARSNDRLDYIGLDENLKQNKQIVFTQDRFIVSDKIELFSNVAHKEPPPKSNGGLLTEKDGQPVRDTFAHEQNLIIEEDGKVLLLTGCAHNGIINILEHFHLIKGRMPDCVIGGFHLFSRSGGEEDADTIDRIGRYLTDKDAMYYTCHCTGMPPYKRLKSVMGDKIEYLSAGSEITI